MELNRSILILVAFIFISFSPKSDASPKTAKKLLRVAILASSAALNLDGVSAANQDNNFCCLCDNCDFPVSGRETLYVDSKGKTCSDVFLKMRNPNNESTVGSHECNRLINLHRPSCCDPSYNPTPISQDPTDPPVGQGDHPACNVCKNGSFPTLPNTLVAVLDTFLPGGPFTCKQLYWLGRYGHISEQLCNPLVNIIEDPCGCLDSEPTLSPTESSDDDWDYPPKQERPDDSSKESAKLSQNDRNRGGIHVRHLRKARLKGM